MRVPLRLFGGQLARTEDGRGGGNVNDDDALPTRHDKRCENAMRSRDCATRNVRLADTATRTNEYR